jgi:hypothetical protein
MQQHMCILLKPFNIHKRNQCNEIIWTNQHVPMLFACPTKKIHALKSEHQLRKYSSGSIVHYTFDVLDFYIVAHLAQTIYFWFYKKNCTSSKLYNSEHDRIQYR